MGLAKKVYNTLLSKQIPGFKVRSNQLKMVEWIEECLTNINNTQKDGHNLCLIEAPTGTGKSLGYLIPTIANAKAIDKKLVISTATKTLQTQLIKKDIPSFIKSTGIDIKYGLAKGRGNYLCPYQLSLSVQNLAFDLLSESDAPHIKASLESIYDNFALGTWDGDLDTYKESIDPKLRLLITTDQDRCINQTCIYNQKDNPKCPFYNNKSYLRSCDLIVTNHSLLLTDLMIGPSQALPFKPQDYVLCLDEAHNLIDYAISSFIQSFDLKDAVDSCKNLSKLLYNPQTASYLYGIDNTIVTTLQQQTELLLVILEEFNVLLNQNLHLFKDNRLILNDYLNLTLPSLIIDKFKEAYELTKNITQNLNKIKETLKEELKTKPDFNRENNLNKIGFYLTHFTEIHNCLEYLLSIDESRYKANAKWIDLKVNNNEIRFAFTSGPTHVGNLLYYKLWSQVYAAVLTSATLTIGKDFNYYINNFGLNLLTKIHTLKLDSDFNYKSQSQIVVPRFTHAPEYTTRNEFTRELINYLVKSLDYSENYGTLVLFFNKAQLIECYNLLPTAIQKKVLAQTEFISNQKLIQTHKQNIDQGKSSIIFGLNSFAEGVDLPSLYCMHVIITKLPFETFKDPQNMVQEYWINAEKGSYFLLESLPRTCIKLIQAVGRLIRDEHDYGQVTICDNRIVTKGYGRVLLDALPEFNRKYNSNFINESLAKIKHI